MATAPYRAAPRRPSRRALAAVYTSLVVLGWLGIQNAGCRGTLRLDPVQSVTTPLLQDERLELARRFAPFVYHEVDPRRGRQDIPTRVDFDGDLVGENNWDDLPFFALPPTLYYAVLETETHWFLSYHLFHPRDWARVQLGFNDTHENDGESLQVVVEKARERPVLLLTQAHFRGVVYAAQGAGFAGASQPIRGALRLVDELGRPVAEGRHACVFVESEGHGIHGLDDARARVRLDDAGGAQFDLAGLVLRPAAPGEAVAEPDVDARASVPYGLESTAARLWPGVRSGALIGFGRLFDGPVDYADERVALRLPRYYEADRFSGPLGSDRGISPFALDFGFDAGTLGALFFDPARRWAEALAVPEPWSRAYLSYPY